MRSIALAAVVLALTGALVASVGAGTQVAVNTKVVTAKPGIASASAACKGGLVSIAGKKVCLKPGLKCKTRYETIYRRKGFHCANGRLERIVKPSISVTDASRAEGNSGATNLSFTVSLSKATVLPVSVNYATSDGTATAADYQSATGKLTFSPGQNSKTIDVAVVGETTYEQHETFTVTLSNPVNATIADGSATGTITNDDVAPRSGHYAGTTAQGRSITFDVAPDLRSLSKLIFYADLSCVELSLSIPNAQLDLTGVTFPVAADWSFAFDIPYSNPGVEPGTVTVAVSGKLSVAGSAGGTLRVNLTQDLPVFGVVHCSSGDVAWSAS